MIMRLGFAFATITTLLILAIPPAASFAQENSPPLPEPQGVAVPDEDAKTAQSAARYAVDLSLSGFNLRDQIEHQNGRALVDIEIRWDGSDERFSGIWFPIAGTTYTLIQGTTAEWNDFFGAMNPRDGRFLDVEVGYFNGQKRYSAIFYEDGDDYSYALRTTNSDSGFQSRLKEYYDDGLAIIDFEAYEEPNGTMRYAGVWVNDPNQPRTHLYYHLESSELSDLLRPLHGRIIDFERYRSTDHDNEIRYALIVTAYPGGGWGHYRNLTESQLDARDAEIADGNTHLIDLEVWGSHTALRYGAVWGDTYKSLHEVDGIPLETDEESIPASVASAVNSFETTQGTSGTIGFHARNVRTQQSIGYRATEPFYLASTAKTAVHIRLWQLAEAGHLNLQTDTIRYTNGTSTPDPFFVDDRPLPGLTSCRCGTTCTPTNGRTSDFNQSFNLQRLDRAMMQVSDNAATSMLVDDPSVGLASDGLDLNEWLSGISGVGRGWGVITSIQALDRLILWQGGVMDMGEPSLFLAPRGSLETYSRCNSDIWGTLGQWVQTTYPSYSGGDGIPNYSSTTGHARYYNTGLSSAEPRAVSNLLQKFVQGDFLNANNTQAALNVMTENSPLRYPGLPSHITVSTKGGVKGGSSRPVSDAGVYRIGPDNVVMGFFSKDNARTTGPIRGFFRTMAPDLLQALTANLRDAGASIHFLSTENAQPGDRIGVGTAVDNIGGGDAPAYDVSFYASTNSTIEPQDIHLGRVRVQNHLGGTRRPALLITDLPTDIPPGTYYVGWLIDPVNATNPLGEVGEYLERSGDIISAGEDPRAHYNPAIANRRLTIVVPEEPIYLPLQLN